MILVVDISNLNILNMYDLLIIYYILSLKRRLQNFMQEVMLNNLKTRAIALTKWCQRIGSRRAKSRQTGNN